MTGMPSLLSKGIIGRYIEGPCHFQLHASFKVIILLNTQHSSEIRDKCKYNATRVNAFLLSSTPFKLCECGGGGWEQALADLRYQASEPVDKKALCVMM